MSKSRTASRIFGAMADEAKGGKKTGEWRNLRQSELKHAARSVACYYTH